MKIWEGGQQIDAPGRKLFDQASATTLYIGEARAGTEEAFSAWQIQRITFDVSGNPTEIAWANNGAAVSVWNDRASLEYK